MIPASSRDAQDAPERGALGQGEGPSQSGESSVALENDCWSGQRNLRREGKDHGNEGDDAEKQQDHSCGNVVVDEQQDTGTDQQHRRQKAEQPGQEADDHQRRESFPGGSPGLTDIRFAAQNCLAHHMDQQPTQKNSCEPRGDCLDQRCRQTEERICLGSEAAQGPGREMGCADPQSGGRDEENRQHQDGQPDHRLRVESHGLDRAIQDVTELQWSKRHDARLVCREHRHLWHRALWLHGGTGRRRPGMRRLWPWVAILGPWGGKATHYRHRSP